MKVEMFLMSCFASPSPHQDACYCIAYVCGLEAFGCLVVASLSELTSMVAHEDLLRPTVLLIVGCLKLFITVLYATHWATGGLRTNSNSFNEIAATPAVLG